MFARDNAGHITTASAQYEVDQVQRVLHAGLDNPPAVNSAKAGAGVPVKFRLQRLQGGVLVRGRISDPDGDRQRDGGRSDGGACSGTPDPIETTTV